MVRRLTYPYRASRQGREDKPEMPLLDLPEALRQRIWETVLHDGRNPVSFLQTCSQIHREAQPLIFDKPLSFLSQYDLVEWVTIVGSTYAKGVKSLQLILQDLEVLPQNRESAHLSWPSLSLLELYQSETEKVIELLRRLPYITELALLKPTTVSSYLYTDFYFAVVRRVAHEFPQLAGFSFYSDEHSLQFAKALTKLRRFSFTGYSRSTSMETLNVLSHLRHLEELEILLPNTPMVCGGLELETALPRSHSLTREVIRDIRGLKRFTLRERQNQHKQTPTFCTARFMQAFESVHRHSLQVLRIDLNFTPDVACQRTIRALCKSSNLKHLDILWPGMRSDILQSLPRSLITLRIHPTFGRPPYWVFLALQWRRSDTPRLEEVYLVGDTLSSALSPQTTSTQAFKSANAALVALNVRTFIQTAQTTSTLHNRSSSATT